VPNGHGLRGASVQATDEAELRARYELGDRPVVFSPSAKRPVKNLARLLDALALLPAERHAVLVLPGYATPHEEDLKVRARELGVDRDVRFPGWLPDADIEGLYAACTAVVLPSLYEGFGLPVLEAMARGVPVACSARGSLAEVSAGAALHFVAEDAHPSAAAMDRLLADVPLRARLATAGHERALGFTWERTARSTVDSYRRAMAGSAGR
jgi:glycosyltransferase involved in cell wall biosynthesis